MSGMTAAVAMLRKMKATNDLAKCMMNEDGVAECESENREVFRLKSLVCFSEHLTLYTSPAATSETSRNACGKNTWDVNYPHLHRSSGTK